MAASSTPAKRTRTGCRTCRQRKLKCDEQKPTCGQCLKSNRECVPSEGVSFRHAQNAGFTNPDGTHKDLASFYKYRQKFDNDYFLPVPTELTFIQVTDPYAEDPPPPTRAALSHHQHQFQAQQLPELIHQPTEQYADVAASSLKAMIDPNLEQALEMSIAMKPEDVLYPVTTAEMEADRFQETMLAALREDDELDANQQPPHHEQSNLHHALEQSALIGEQTIKQDERIGLETSV